MLTGEQVSVSAVTDLRYPFALDVGRFLKHHNRRCKSDFLSRLPHAKLETLVFDFKQNSSEVVSAGFS